MPTGRPTSAATRAVSGLRRRTPRHEGARYGRRRRLQHRADGARGRAGRRRLCAESGRLRRASQRPNFDARIKTPAMKDVVPTSRPFDDPVPPDLHDLDLITFLFYYHDTTYMTVDRAEMDRKLFAALKPGGYLVIADHSASRAKGLRSARHCIASRRATLRKEVEAAGFRVVAEGNFWRTPTTRTTSRATADHAGRQFRAQVSEANVPGAACRRPIRAEGRCVWPLGSRAARTRVAHWRTARKLLRRR